MRDEMRAAYRLIYDYKSGQIEPGSAISEDQRRLIRLLAADLEVETEGVEIGTLVARVARADTRWNHETMAALADLHDLRAAGRSDEAEAIRTRFLGSCPSVWYCAILADV